MEWANSHHNPSGLVITSEQHKGALKKGQHLTFTVGKSWKRTENEKGVA
jgi:hypothetical protein